MIGRLCYLSIYDIFLTNFYKHMLNIAGTGKPGISAPGSCTIDYAGWILFRL